MIGAAYQQKKLSNFHRFPAFFKSKPANERSFWLVCLCESEAVAGNPIGNAKQFLFTALLTASPYTQFLSPFVVAMANMAWTNFTSDSNDAYMAWARAAKAGCTTAAVNQLVCELRSLCDAPKPEDPVAAFAALQRYADAGDETALLNLALCHLDGVVVVADEAKGLELLQTAATRGMPIAQGLLGEFYYDGTKTLAADRAKGTALMRDAAHGGDTASLLSLVQGLINEGLCSALHKLPFS